MDTKIDKLVESFDNLGNHELAQACQSVLILKNEYEMEVNNTVINTDIFSKYKKVFLENFSQFDNECLDLSIDTSSFMKELKSRS